MKKIMFVLLVFVSTLVYCAEFEAFMSSRGRNLLRSSQDEVLTGLKFSKFIWNNEKHTSILYSQKLLNGDLTFAELPVIEAVFEFSDKNHLESVKMSMYNRADCGQWSKERFDKAVSTLSKRIGSVTKVKQPDFSKQKLSGSTIHQGIWHSASYDVALCWCATDESTEYITINIEDRRQIKDIRQDMRTVVNTADLTKRIRKERGGIIWVDVPMVNQGERGYCVVAGLERIFRYYNSSIDQHMLAQIMASDPSQGTNMQVALETLEKNANKLRIRVKTVYNEKLTAENLEKFIKDYNRAASKKKKGKANADNIRRAGYDQRAMIAEMDPDIYLDLRSDRKPGVKSFFSTVKNSIDRGIPLVWSVILVKNEVKEQPDISYHMRIINGYNEKTGEIIYTDSWGAGHERKSMPAKRAWATTNMIMDVRPK